MNKLKPRLTMTEIGHFKFYMGIAIGLVYGTISALWFLLLDKSFLILYDLKNKNFIKDIDLDLSLYNSLLTGLTSSALGFSMTLYLWTSQAYHSDRKRKLRMRTAHMNALFVYMLIMFVFTKFLTFDTSLKYDGFGIDLKQHYGYYPFLLPLFIFLFNWLSVQRAFKSWKFLALSAMAVFYFGVVIGLIIAY